jgi:hypothetical protein
VFVRADPVEATTRPAVRWGLILGCASLLLLLVSLGTWFPLSLILAGAAYGLARKGDPADSRVRAARVVGIIALALGVVAMIVWTVLWASGFTPSDLQQWLEDELRRLNDRRSSGAQA